MNAMVDIYVPQDPYSKPFTVLSFSRQTLLSLGFTYEQVSSLADEDMSRVAESLAKTYPDFLKRVKFNVRLYLAS